jgi:carbon monoxide dehydrogenase subunit G
MLTTSGSTVIGVPIEAVFDTIADVRNEPRWLPGASNVQLTSGEPVGAGSTFIGHYARAGTVHLRIAHYERPVHLTLAGEAKTLNFTDDIELSDDGGATSLTATMTTVPKGAFRLMAPLMARIIDREFQANWNNLKAMLESDASA